MQLPKSKLRFVGVELYFDNLEAAKRFYRDTLHLDVSEEQPGHHVKFGASSSFVCLERKGSESYPSLDKAVLFFEVSDLPVALEAIGRDKIIQSEPEGTGRPGWVVIHDPEGHNILLLPSQK